MSTKDMFSKERVNFNLMSDTKDEVIKELINILVQDGKIKDKEVFFEAVKKREEEFSTGIGFGIAIPHGKSDVVIEPCIAYGRSTKGIDYDSMDGEKAHMFFLIAVPQESSDIHLRALSEISRKLMHEEIRKELLGADDFQKFIKVFSE